MLHYKWPGEDTIFDALHLSVLYAFNKSQDFDKKCFSFNDFPDVFGFQMMFAFCLVLCDILDLVNDI